MIRLSAIAISALASLILVGCGGGDSSTTTDSSGQLVDNYIKNVSYTCGDDTNGTTDVDGKFICNSLPVTFSIGGVKLGTITNMTADNQVFPYDLIGVDRSDVTNPAAVAMARFLQSCDEDADTSNGISISESVKSSLDSYDEPFSEDNLDAYATDANVSLISEDEAILHITHTLSFVEAVDATDLPIEIKDALLGTKSTITQDLLNTLSYMGNEERLAYDTYNELYKTSGAKQLTNIATKSEYKHIQTVQLLVKKYLDTNSSFTNIDATELSYQDTPIENMAAGQYDISKIQDLYNFLIEKGKASVQDALEVGCMVEVTDVDDLDKYIDMSSSINADDITTAFNFLRDGSYRHYWGFDKGLKDMGVTEGCCILGDSYCHPEYPNTKHKKNK